MGIVDDISTRLAQLRADRRLWTSVAYEPRADDQEQRGDDEDCGSDRNELARAQALWALQYDLRDDDAELTRFLLSEEARYAHDEIGIGDELHLAGLLVAERPRVTDVWLHWRAKTASFDTQCGYESALLFAAGIRATTDHVTNSEHPERDALLASLRDLATDDDEIRRTLAHLRDLFPQDPAREPATVWMARCRRIGDLVGARRHLDRWALDLPRDRQGLRSLSYALADLGDFASARDSQRALTELPGQPMDVAGEWIRLAALERGAGDDAAALAALRRCERSFSDLPDWRQLGLGRSFVETLFQLAATTTSDLVARDAYELGHRLGWTMPRLALTTLLEAAVAAERLAAPHAWRERAEAERQRIAR